ncbi:MAG: hypothetical protein AAB794_00015, partial [Patescibacteria group bacterium]
PEKYIRTFAGDMDMVKKGGTPDLAPLGAVSPPKPTAPPIAPKPVQPPVPATPPPPLVIAPVSPAPPQVAPKNPPLQTYSNDFSERMKTTHASTATVLAAEQDKAPRAPHVASQESPSSISLPYVIASLVLLVVSLAGGTIAYMQYRTASAPVVTTPVVSTPIFVDEREEISGIDATLLQSVVSSVSRPLAAGTVRLLYVATASDENIFTALPVSAPDVLLRNVQTKGSMAGVINVGGNQSPFFILSVSSYSTVFSSMLAWEPLMPDYLSELFPSYQIPIGETTATSTVATTTETASASVAGFYDATIVNHDVRVYRDASGRDMLLYGFWNQATLIIARDATAFTEIVGRLSTASTPR